MVSPGRREARRNKEPEDAQHARQDRTRRTLCDRRYRERFQGVLSRRGVAGGARARARSARPAASSDGSIWHRDDAAVAQRAGRAGDPRSRRRRTRWRARPTTISPSRWRSARRAFRAWRRCRCRTPISPPGSLSAASRSFGFRGALVNGFSQVGDLDTTVYYDLKQYWPFWQVVEAARRAVLPASAQPAAARRPDLRRPSLAARTDLGVRPGDRGAFVAADGLRAVRRVSAHPDRARPHGRGAAVQHVARRSYQRLDSKPAQSAPVQEEHRRITSTPTST